MNHQLRNSPKIQRDRTDRFLALTAIGTLVIAYTAGILLQENGVREYVDRAVPEADRIEETGSRIFTTYRRNDLIGYVAIGQAHGYGSPLQVAVATDIKGTITGLSVISHKETTSFFKRVLKNRHAEQFFGKSYADSFQLGVDIDRVTGAAYTF